MGYLFGISLDLVLWMGLSALVGIYWKGKGRSFIAGFVFSVFLTPVVGLLLGVVRPANRKLILQLKCPHCGARQSAKNALCEQCYKDLKQVNPQTGEIEPLHKHP